MKEAHVGSAWKVFAEDFYRYSIFSDVPEEKTNFYVEQVRRKCSDKLELLVGEIGATIDRIGIPGFIIGNTAESMLEQVKCSVLAIKPDGFQPPVL